MSGKPAKLKLLEMRRPRSTTFSLPRLLEIVRLLRLRSNKDDLPRIVTYLRGVTGDERMSLTKFVSTASKDSSSTAMINEQLDRILAAVKGGEWALLETEDQA